MVSLPYPAIGSALTTSLAPTSCARTCTDSSSTSGFTNGYVFFALRRRFYRFYPPFKANPAHPQLSVVQLQAKSISNPFAYAEFRAQQIDNRVAANRASRISRPEKRPKVNRNLAQRMAEAERKEK